jgi:roadblock/LC7 domain-containing protein
MEQMEKNAIAAKTILKTLALGTAGVGTLAGTGYAGHKIGFKSGANVTANKMTNAFIDANNRENAQIKDSFMDFNKKENLAIANMYLDKGYRAGLKQGNNGAMSKAAEASYEEAFQKEMSKLGYAGIIRSGLKTLKNMSKKVKSTASNLSKREKVGIGAGAGAGAAGTYALS